MSLEERGWLVGMGERWCGNRWLREMVKSESRDLGEKGYENKGKAGGRWVF